MTSFFPTPFLLALRPCGKLFSFSILTDQKRFAHTPQEVETLNKYFAFFPVKPTWKLDSF